MSTSVSAGTPAVVAVARPAGAVADRGRAGVPVLECVDLAKTFGARAALDGLSLSVFPGEIYGLLGPNGAGKTTTIRLACGLISPDRGEVRVAGAPVPRPGRSNGWVGLVPQELALYDPLTGRENLEFFGRVGGIRGRALGEAVDAALDAVGLAGRADDRVQAYSGGMKRRLNIAVALLRRPRLLVLDEPTVGVDPQSRIAILDVVAALATDGMAVLFASHQMSEVERVCHRVGIIDGGVLICEGAPEEVRSLVDRGDEVTLSTRGDLDDLADACRRVDGAEDVRTGDDAVRVRVSDLARVLPAIMLAASEAGAPVSSLSVTEVSLEDAFLQLTGDALRDG